MAAASAPDCWRGTDRSPGWSHPHGGRGGAASGSRLGPGGLAVLIALAQVIGTTLAARDQPAGLDLLGYVLLAAGGLALATRLRHPVATLVVVGAVTLAYQGLGYPNGPTFVALIFAGIAAVKAGRRYPTWLLAAAGYALWLWLVQPGLRPALVVAAWIVGVLLLAEWARTANAYRARAMQAQQEQARARAEQQRRQASEERLRTARELHDVLGHHLSLINVQAGVGLHLMDNQPEQARAALGTIRQASAEALREVRSVLAALHPSDEAAPRTPAPGLRRLSELTVDAGLAVHSAVRGEPQPVPAPVDRAAYRIVQEALTNVRRHAGPGAAATVLVTYQREELMVRVSDDGTGGEPLAVATDGSGINGMRERATALGGSLRAGPRPGGGFEVLARLPLPAEGAS